MVRAYGNCISRVSARRRSRSNGRNAGDVGGGAESKCIKDHRKRCREFRWNFGASKFRVTFPSSETPDLVAPRPEWAAERSLHSHVSRVRLPLFPPNFEEHYFYFTGNVDAIPSRSERSDIYIKRLTRA